MMDPRSQLLDIKRVEALETWLKTTNTKLTQVNGQRKYGGPPEVWHGPAPGTHCEIFISQIPRDTYEDLLIPLFSSVGPLWEFRLMMNFSGQNRGFAYSKYGSPATATEAIRKLHGYLVEPGCRLSVCRSTEKRHLCIEELPATMRREDLLKVLQALTEGVERVSLKAELGVEGNSAIVAFTSHYAASMAKKVLVEAFKKQFAVDISIKWQSTMKPSGDEPQRSHLPFALKPPCHILSSSQPSVWPPCRAHPPSTPLVFCRAVGGPTASQLPVPPTSFSSFQVPCMPSSSSFSPVILLRALCEVTGVGQPHYEMQYSHTGPDGFLYFTYKVCVPGITAAFKGLVMILPGPTVTTMLEEARRAAAHQVLQRVYNRQLSR